MDTSQFQNVVWCDLEIVALKIHSYELWDSKMVSTCQKPNKSQPVVNVFICRENDIIFDDPKTYRENIMSKGLYVGHHFGKPAKLKHIDDNNIALYHQDPGKIIWCFVIKYVLTLYSIKRNMLHIKGGAIAYKGKSFLVLGRGGSGKTEAIKALCKNGADFMANTHLLIYENSAYGIKSNIRVRNTCGDEYIPINRYQNHLYEGWLPIGGVFWMNYRTDGITLVDNIPPEYAKPNLNYFAEAIGNWEMKEDIADYYNFDPFEFALQMNNVNKKLDDFCRRNHFYYLNLDILSNAGIHKALEIMEYNL